MSSCSRWLLFLLVVLSASAAQALNVNAVYRTACTRELGVILRVEKRAIHLLGLDGVIKKIPRHEIVSIAYYPVSQLPLRKAPESPSVPVIHVETLYEGAVSSLATGWPVDYSETKIAFLLQNGKDIVIEKESIWSLTIEEGPAARVELASAPVELEFVHPQSSGFCDEAPATQPATEPATQPTTQPTTQPVTQPAPRARRIFAQQILNDPIVIKRELDRLEEGYLEVQEYLGDQKFYPVPFLYVNKTELGLWVSLQSRYGASKSRPNNFTPTVVDELALGPFRYQHYFLSGSAPNSMLLHDEAQSQIYYRFKAAYFHASVMLDPNLLLVGNKYPWREEDLSEETLDDRFSEFLALEFGFDFGPLAIELAPAVVAQAAVKMPGHFNTIGDANLWRVGLRFTHRLFLFEALGGFSNHDRDSSVGSTDWNYKYARFNVAFEPWRRLELELAEIIRTLDYSASGAMLEYDSLSMSTSVLGRYALSHRFVVGGSLMGELQTRDGGDGKKSRFLPKIAAFTSFSF